MSKSIKIDNNIQIALIGNPSTGKSFSLRNLNPEETFIISPNKKSLPFKNGSKNYKFLSAKNPKGNRGFCNQLTTVKDRTGSVISKGLFEWIEYINTKRPEITTLVIEDITHFFHARTQSSSFRQSKDWGKWGDFGADVFNAIINPDLYRDGLAIVHIYHAEIVDRNGTQISKIMTEGQVLDRKILPSSYYTYSLHTAVKSVEDVDDPEDRFVFITNNDGEHDCKTSYGLFDLEIPNDIKFVIDKIVEFEYGQQ